MSKIAILKSLPTPSELRQSVQELASLEQLPDLVADQVTQAMAPLLTLRQDVAQSLQAFDQVTKAQRSSLEAMATELTDRATKGMEQKAAELDQVITDLAGQVQGLQSSMASMEASSKKLQALPQSLDSAARNAAKEMQSSAGELARTAQEVRPSGWLTLGQMLGAAVLGALLVAAGQVGLNRLLPPSETQQSADWAASLWAKASESEKKLLNQIASRPGR